MVLAVTVIALVPEVGFGVKAVPTLLGSPERARLTLPVNPYSGLTVTVGRTVFPTPTVTVPGPVKVKVG
jgi:hypothetical protein